MLAKIKTGAIIGVVGTAVGFGAGWAVNGWRLEAKFAEAQVAAIETYKGLQKEVNERFVAQAKVDMATRIALAEELLATRSYTEELERELESVTLTAKTPRIEQVLTDGECGAKVVIANPFSDDFVRLWNASASGSGPGGPAAGEASGGDDPLRPIAEIE